MHFGRRVRSAGLGWHWLVFFVFVDTTDTWALGRRQRIAVSLAGPLTSSVLAGLASWAALWQRNLFGTAALWQFALMANLSLLSNLNPLKARDGYYILSDLLERPNLRQRAFSALARLVPGFRSTAPQWRAGWPEMLYGAAALVFIGAMTVSSVASYRVVVKAHIDRFLPETLADVLPWAIGLLIVTVAALWALGSLRIALRELAASPAAAAPGAAPPEDERRG